jgi:hypothetical protein
MGFALFRCWLRFRQRPQYAFELVVSSIGAEAARGLVESGGLLRVTWLWLSGHRFRSLRVEYNPTP